MYICTLLTQFQFITQINFFKTENLKTITIEKVFCVFHYKREKNPMKLVYKYNITQQGHQVTNIVRKRFHAIG